VREVAVGGVDDGVDRLVQQIAADDPEDSARGYFFLREDLRFRGTLAPARRASDRPMAIACFLLVTFLPERPLRNVPRFRSRITFLTFCDAFLLYLRAIDAPTRFSPSP